MMHGITEEKLQHLFETENFAEKMQSCEDPDSLFALFTQYGLVAGREEFDAYMADAAKTAGDWEFAEGELDEDDLELVAGGANKQKVKYHITQCTKSIKQNRFVSAVKHFGAAVYYASPFK